MRSQVLSRYGAFVNRAPPSLGGHLDQVPSAGGLEQVWLAGLLFLPIGFGSGDRHVLDGREKAYTDVWFTTPGTPSASYSNPGTRANDLIKLCVREAIWPKA